MDPRRIRSFGQTYVASLAVLAAAVGLRWLLDPILHDDLPLVTVFGAVAASVWMGGYRPAVVVGIVGYVACQYLFIDPRGELSIYRADQLIGFAAYLLTISLIIAAGHEMRVARNRAHERGEVLRVEARSAGAGQGSEFIVRLPRVRTARAPVASPGSRASAGESRDATASGL